MASDAKRTSIGQFFREVRQEGRKVTWTSRRETIITTVMVLIMVTIAAVFFLLVDLIISSAIRGGMALFGAVGG